MTLNTVGGDAGVDLVIPFYNEEKELPLLLQNLSTQTDSKGDPLGPGSLRVILVDNGSTDQSNTVLEKLLKQYDSLEAVVLKESVKSHIQARIRGASFALEPKWRRRFPILANADADTRFHPLWISDAAQRLSDGLDVVSYAGYFPDSFWARVPHLTQSYFQNVGTIFFSRQVIERFGFAGREALFTEKIFLDFGRMPSDCGFALTKEIYERAGCYRREYWPDGQEVLGEGWNLKFRLDSVGARTAYVNAAPYQTSPRRLLLEAERMLAGESYSSEMSDLRDEPLAQHYDILDGLPLKYDFEALKRYVIKNYILLQCITAPSKVLDNPEYFSPATGELKNEIESSITVGFNTPSAAIYKLAEDLSERYYDLILHNVRNMRNVV